MSSTRIPHTIVHGSDLGPSLSRAEAARRLRWPSSTAFDRFARLGLTVTTDAGDRRVLVASVEALREGVEAPSVVTPSPPPRLTTCTEAVGADVSPPPASLPAVLTRALGHESLPAQAWYSATEVGAILGFDERTVRRFVRAGVLGAGPSPDSRIRIRAIDLARWADVEAEFRQALVA